MKPPAPYLLPVLAYYKNISYSSMETAIFPSYFHGKCQRNGVDPVGCPNPDCPVVCGTPGSLVHFYSKLQYIAFNETTSLLGSLCSPGSDTYAEVERTVLRDASRPARRMLRYTRSMTHPIPGIDSHTTSGFPFAKRDQNAMKAQLKNILHQLPTLMQEQCGGRSLSDCSWETDMKKYILSFP